MTVVYDWSKVSRETLENLAHAMLTNSLDNGAFEYHTAGNDAYNAAVAALRNAVAEARPAPMRTRAERDRELTDLLGCSAHAPQHGREITFNIERENLHRILDLIVESTASESERCVAADLAFDCLDPKCKAHDRVLTEPEPLAPDPNHTDVIRPPDAPEPDRCSCEEALALRKRIAQLEEMVHERGIQLVATFERALKAEREALLRP